MGGIVIGVIQKNGYPNFQNVQGYDGTKIQQILKYCLDELN